MTEPRPLLAFAPAVTGPIPTGMPRFIPGPRTPTAARQGRRLAPQFAALQEALAAGRTQTADVTAEPDPELVVVFDVAGTVDRFIRAVAGIKGLEFLAELAEDPTEPDEDFYYETDGEATDAAVPETLYMVMSNAQAVTELVRLFELWQANPDITFERGLAPLKQAFSLLRAVRRWGTADRIRETGLLQAWTEDVAVAGGQGFTRVEIELWFRDNAARRTAVQADIERLITTARGTLISSAVVPSIDYHAVLADFPYDQVQAVLERGPEAIELLTTESIMFVAPARPMTTPALELAADLSSTASLAPPRDAAPRVALLDGLPMANHTALTGRLIIDDPDERARRYSSGQQHHGTAMASLICNGDLSSPGRRCLPSSTSVRSWSRIRSTTARSSPATNFWSTCYTAPFAASSKATATDLRPRRACGSSTCRSATLPGSSPGASAPWRNCSTGLRTGTTSWFWSALATTPVSPPCPPTPWMTQTRSGKNCSRPPTPQCGSGGCSPLLKRSTCSPSERCTPTRRPSRSRTPYSTPLNPACRPATAPSDSDIAARSSRKSCSPAASSCSSAHLRERPDRWR